MKTERLVEVLAHEAGPQPRGVVERRILIAAGAGLAVAIGLVPLLFGFRADLGQSMGIVLLKGAFGFVAAIAAAPLLFELARPNTRIRHVLVPAAIFAGMSIIGAAAAYVITPPDARMHSWLGGEAIPQCLYRIPLLALPIAVALVLAIRGLGATRLTLAGAAVGAVSGSLAVIAYASCCPMDSALYVASWYLAAILFCAFVGAWLAERVLRW